MLTMGAEDSGIVCGFVLRASDPSRPSQSQCLDR